MICILIWRRALAFASVFVSAAFQPFQIPFRPFRRDGKGIRSEPIRAGLYIDPARARQSIIGEAARGAFELRRWRRFRARRAEISGQRKRLFCFCCLLSRALGSARLGAQARAL